MAALVNSSRFVKPEIAVVSLTTVQRALWQLGMPVLDANAVAGYKKRAQRGMFWSAIRWQLAGMAALVGFVSLGREWGRAAVVAAAAVVLATLFGWLLAYDLQWLTIGYSNYRAAHAVPPHVAAAAEALMANGVPQNQIGVEFLKIDPILFVEDPEQRLGIKRYDLIVW